MVRSWLVAWSFAAVAFGGASLVIPLYIIELGGTAVTLGILAAVATFFGVPGALAIGRLADRTGHRRTYILWSMIVTGVVLLFVPFIDSIAVVIAANATVWLAFAAATPILTLLAVAGLDDASWGGEIARLNKYQGWGWAIGLLIGTMWTAVGLRLYDSMAVLRGFLVLLGLFAIAGALLGHKTLPSDAIGRTSRQRLMRAVRNADRFSIRAATFPMVLVRVEPREYHPRLFVDRFTANLGLYFGAVFLFFVGFSIFFAPLPAFLTEMEYSSDAVFSFYLIVSLVAAVSFDWAGVLASRNSLTTLNATGMVARAVAFPLVALVGYWFGSTMVGFSASAVVFGVIGLSWALFAVTAITLVSRLSPPTIQGESMGVYVALGAFGGGIGSLAGGWIAARDFFAAFAIAGGFLLLGAIAVLWLRFRLSSDGSSIR